MSISVAVNMTAITCCHSGCGIVFAVPVWWEKCRRGDHKTWYCPNGHDQLFQQETEAEKAQKEAAALRAKLDQERMASRTAALERDKAVKANKRLRTRAKFGVCPFCKRTFKQLAEHMECKHAGVKA